jgi:Na+/melibiose symporter-like transporter
MITSGQTFISKSASGIGTMLAGVLLGLVGFPADTDPTDVPRRVLAQLGVGYIVPWVFFGCLAVWVISRYEISRSSHERDLAELGADDGRV